MSEKNHTLLTAVVVDCFDEVLEFVKVASLQISIWRIVCEQNFSNIIDGRRVGLYKQSVEVYSESFGHQMILISRGGGG